MPRLTQTYMINELAVLENVKDGSPIKLKAVGKVDTKDGKMVVIDWSEFDLETENQADKELKNMTRKEETEEQVRSGDSIF